jgi:hypothetical protein
MAIAERPSRFWIITAAVSVFGTMSALGTAIAVQQAAFRNLPIPDFAVSLFAILAFTSALGSSAVAMDSMLIQGLKETGKLPLCCMAFYAAPWLPLGLLLALT